MVRLLSNPMVLCTIVLLGYFAMVAVVGSASALASAFASQRRPPDPEP